MATVWNEQSIIWTDMALQREGRPLDLLMDPRFENGFAVYGPRHSDFVTAQYAGRAETTAQQCWHIAQWGVYKHPFTKETKRVTTEKGFIYSTPSVSIETRYDDPDFGLRMEIHASMEYQDHVRQDGEDWPHLILEQHHVIETEPDMGQLGALDYACEIQLEYCACAMRPDQINPDKHAAQISHYWAIGDPVAKDWFWFGITFFDNRHEIFPGYASRDVGKADATNKMIVVPPQTTFNDVPAISGEWMTYQADLKPLIRQAVLKAQRQGYLRECRFERMKLLSTNIGYEMPGSYDSAFRIRRLSLIGR